MAGAMGTLKLFLVVFAVCTVFSGSESVETNYVIGTGIADITGPAAEVNMMGYANPAQTTHGLHLRQYSRAFIITDSKNSTPIVFVSTDSCMQSQGLKQEVVKRLKAKYGNLYNERNLCISGTHTHSGPAGFHEFLLYDITSLGFVQETFDALVIGIVRSIERAHSNMKKGNLYIKTEELLESNINRSPTAYLLNPAEERAKYKYDVDKNITVLKIVNENNEPMGMISWFAVHCTSMNNTNHLISSDNKGLASQLFEAAMDPGKFPGQGSFVAAFAQSNLGDVSPNTAGPRCLDTGKVCDAPHSTCNGRNELCVAFGPGKDMFDSTRIIANNQYNKAMDMFKSSEGFTQLTGPVDFRHTYVNMTNVEVQVNSSYKTTTCKTAMGYAFAAGTTDGPGAFDFTQGTTSTNPLWNAIVNFIRKPSVTQVECHHPKPILLDTGEITFPYPWQPEVVDAQIFRVGQLAIVAVPAEFTTMSGRRTRDAVTATLKAGGFPEDTVSVIAGLSNDYADYVTTPEEYQQQRYEGASTIYGPYTLPAYIQQFTSLAESLAKGTPAPAGPDPPNFMEKMWSFVPPVIFDHAPLGTNFGSVVTDAKDTYTPGESVVVTFIGANPRNSLRLEDTFLKVEKKQNQNYVTVFMDSQWETKFEWHRTSTLLGESQSTITWDIPANQAAGTYRISYYGNSKSIDGTISEFNGHSKDFMVQSKKTMKKIDNATKKKGYPGKLNKKYLKYLKMMKYKKEKKDQVNAVIDKLSKNIVVM